MSMGKAETDPGSCCGPARDAWIEAAHLGPQGPRIAEQKGQQFTGLQVRKSTHTGGWSIPSITQKSMKEPEPDPPFSSPSERG